MGPVWRTVPFFRDSCHLAIVNRYLRAGLLRLRRADNVVLQHGGFVDQAAFGEAREIQQRGID